VRQGAERGNRLFDAMLDGYLIGLRDAVYSTYYWQEQHGALRACIPDKLDLNRQTLLSLIDKGEVVRIARTRAKVKDDDFVFMVLEDGIEDVFPCKRG
jgi:hypothetical protein